VDYLKTMLPSLEVQIPAQMAWYKKHNRAIFLIKMQSRFDSYLEDIRHDLMSHHSSSRQSHRATNHMVDANPDWKDCQLDFKLCHHRLEVLQNRAYDLATSLRGLASVAGKRQNLEEAKRVKRLSLLALLFVPLWYTSLLFGMQGPFSPGNNKFWVYCVSAIGAAIITSLSSILLEWVTDGYAHKRTKAAEWSW
jgi:Mg2+ and Co2+ transporter CorA